MRKAIMSKIAHHFMTGWISKTFTSDVGPSLHEDLVDINNRLAGSDGERRGAERTRDTLEAVGARDAHLTEYDIQGWVRGSSEVVAGNESIDCVSLPRSPSGTVEADLLDLGYGLPEDFEDAPIEGKAVVVDTDVPDWYNRFIHRREKYYYAVEGGAAAFLFRNHVEGCLPPTGSVGTKDAPIGDIPAVGLSKESGTRLARLFEGDSVTVSVEADICKATSQNVQAVLGPETNQEVLVTSHIDAHDIAEGALDNGAGTAVLAQTAAALAARGNSLDTKIRFVAFGSEEVGLDGSSHFAETHDLSQVKAVVNNDGSGRARDLRLTTHHFQELAEAANRVADRFDHPIDVVPRLGPHSDHWPFVQRGVPGTQLRSVTGTQGRGWGHTEADTYDKIDNRDIRTHAILVTDLVAEIAREDISIQNMRESEISRHLETENLAKGMKVIGDWPY